MKKSTRPSRAVTRAAACVSPSSSYRAIDSLEEAARGLEVGGSRGHLARAVEKHRALGRLVRELGRLLEVAPRLSGGGERLGALSGAHERRPGLAS